MINTADPDIDLVQKKVTEAIDRAESKGGSPGKGGKKNQSVTGGSLGSLSEGYAANQADDLSAAC
jgi:hypothetical protein